MQNITAVGARIAKKKSKTDVLVGMTRIEGGLSRGQSRARPARDCWTATNRLRWPTFASARISGLGAFDANNDRQGLHEDNLHLLGNADIKPQEKGEIVVCRKQDGLGEDNDDLTRLQNPRAHQILFQFS